MNETMTTCCRVCGGSLTVERPNTGDPEMDATVIRLALGLVHNGCQDKFWTQREAQRMDMMLHRRAEAWTRLCAPFYQNSEAWLATGNRKLNHEKLKKVLAWEYGSKGLLIHGSTSGTGKTTAAWLLLKRQHKEEKFIVALSHSEFSRQATILAKDNDREALAWSKTVRDCDILFIDDLGKSRFKTADGTGKAAEEFMFDMIDHRITHLKPCVFTTNADGQAILDLMSPERAEPFLRRLREFNEGINFDSMF